MGNWDENSLWRDEWAKRISEVGAGLPGGSPWGGHPGAVRSEADHPGGGAPAGMARPGMPVNSGCG